jgi:alpha-L-fucosidase
MGKMAQSAAYNDYIKAQWRELIAHYRPDILWNDIGWPRDSDPLALMAEYYNAVPEGLVNDRFAQHAAPMEDGIIANPRSAHFDIRTPEYTSFADIQAQKWETCRGIAHSFSYNLNESPDNAMTVEALVHLLADIVSKNGNLLLSFGPMADGSVPAVQRDRLLGLGRWLKVNGEAIYGTRPWVIAEGQTDTHLPVRFTRKGDALYAILPGQPEGAITLRGITLLPETTLTLLGAPEALSWQATEDGLHIRWPAEVAHQVAYALRIFPMPTLTAV